jgi:hypothetical protein
MEAVEIPMSVKNERQSYLSLLIDRLYDAYDGVDLVHFFMTHPGEMAIGGKADASGKRVDGKTKAQVFRIDLEDDEQAGIIQKVSEARDALKSAYQQLSAILVNKGVVAVPVEVADMSDLLLAVAKEVAAEVAAEAVQEEPELAEV